MVDYLDVPTVFVSVITVDGRQFTSSVNKDNLTIQMAGICLSGEDQKFDLASMVGVLREGGGGVLRVGDDYGIGEEEYWEIHPPQG